MADRLVHPTRGTIYPTRGLTDSAIRQFVDLQGFVLDKHEEEGVVPGVQPILLQQSGSAITSRIGSTSFIPTNQQLPGGIVTDWGPLIRKGIDVALDWMGGGSNTGLIPAPLQGPLVLGPESGTPGVFPPGGIEGITNVGCGPRPKVGFIQMPNGLPGCPTGYHPEKSGKPYCVRNRRMNALNPRALSRASRRVGGFARAVQRARTLKKVCRSL